ncbi:MAG: hypothetical protein BLM47_04840 [Candidatus Reconcilbacillus cellulovorans]|uniref:Sulfatase N-terminal domain-containing protein n=1 Tax=Candidatus Reconcilbacillus cellulovorans TaxID=1906605 RepID=A0A2A6E1Z9_9BACL|nr:MAG: hypothetical protein BLM47_04840 [Candidatus Reconcilbacillus cellulovorans]
MALRPFGLFSVLIWAKAALAYAVLFGADASCLWRPLVVELPFVWLVFVFIERWGGVRKWAAYWTADLLLTGIYFAVIMYYKYYGIVVTYHALQQINQLFEVRQSVYSLMHPYFLLIFTDLVVMAGWFAWKRGKIPALQSARPAPDKLRRAVAVAAFAAGAFLIWQNRAIVNELRQTREMGIMHYQVYTIISDAARAWTESSSFAAGLPVVTPEVVAAVKGDEQKDVHSPQFGLASGRNVIIVQLESFQNFLLDLTVDGREVTPVMNRLKREAIYFPRFFQQVGQGNTSDAEFVVNTSFYVPSAGAASREYTGRELPGLPRLFRTYGYEAVTFHTNTVEFWNRDELYPALGFSRYYDMAFFGEQDVIAFGASDEVLYRKTAEELDRLHREGKAFYAQVVSLSAHHPYILPEEKIKLKLPDRFAGTLVGRYLQAQHYADEALGLFVDELRSRGLWDRSLVVIYGDHLGLPIYALTREEKRLMAELLGRDYGYVDMLNVPLLVLLPGVADVAPQTIDRVGGQADVFPTVAELMGFPDDGGIRFGKNLFLPGPNLLPQSYYLPSGSFLNDEALFIPGQGFEDGEIYPIRPGAGKPAVTEDEFRRAAELFRMSEQVVRRLPELHRNVSSSGGRE